MSKTEVNPRRELSWYERHVTAKSLFGQFLRKLRRFYLGTFKPEVIQKSIQETRKGECHRCGLCCELIYKCPFLGRDQDQLTYCRIYGDLRPTNCHTYPFDSIDSEIENCGFKFVVQPGQLSTLPEKVIKSKP